jgi:hypothetical protein
MTTTLKATTLMLLTAAMDATHPLWVEEDLVRSW